MDVTLILVDGKASRRDVKLTLPAVIGRSRDAALALGHPRVSRHHCELYERDGALVVRDCDSLNGTFVDNRRINEAVLKPGERLTVGPLTFVAVYEQEGDPTDEAFVAIGAPGDELPPEMPTPTGEDALRYDVDSPGDEGASDADTAERLAPTLPADATEPAPEPAAPAGPAPVLPMPVTGRPVGPTDEGDKTLNSAAEQTIHEMPGDAAEPAAGEGAQDDTGSADSALADFLKDLQ